MNYKSLFETRESNFRGCVENAMLGACGIKLPVLTGGTTAQTNKGSQWIPYVHQAEIKGRT